MQREPKFKGQNSSFGQLQAGLLHPDRGGSGAFEGPRAGPAAG